MSYDLLFRPREQIEAVQEANFAETMDLVCERHGYYRELLARHGLKRADIRSLADLGKLPVTRKEDYMREPERFRLDCEGLPEEMRAVWDVMYTTGSTSGNPTPFVSTSFDFYNILELNRNMLLLRGVRGGDLIASLFPVTRWPHGGFIRALHAACSINIPVVAAMPGKPSPYFALGNGLDEVVRVVERHRATILWGVPSYIRRVAQRAGEMRADFSAVRLVFVTGEALPERSRAELASSLARAGAGGSQISISYGATEMQGGMIECRPGSGFHNPAPDQFHIEIVDPETHAPLEDGREGLVLLTHLKRRGTVLLRYALGDVSARAREACPHCGANTGRLVSMPRRIDRLVKIKGTLVNPDVVIEALEALLGGREFRIVVASENPRDALSPDSLTVMVEGVADAVLGGRIAEAAKASSGVTPSVEFVDARTLVDPDTQWKAKRFVDTRVTFHE